MLIGKHLSCQLEQTEADQCRHHTAKHLQKEVLDADEREVVDLIDYKDVDDDGEEGSDKLHYNSLSEIINSLLPRRPLSNPDGANR